MFSLSYTQINDLKKYDKQFCISKMCFAISYPFEYVKRSQIHHIYFGVWIRWAARLYRKSRARSPLYYKIIAIKFNSRLFVIITAQHDGLFVGILYFASPINEKYNAETQMPIYALSISYKRQLLQRLSIPHGDYKTHPPWQ